MAESDLNKLVSTDLATLILFYWDEAETETARYTSWTTDLSIFGGGSLVPGVYTSATGVEVSNLPAKDGSLEDRPAVIRMPSNLLPVSRIREGFAHAPVDCVIAETQPSDSLGLNTTRRLHTGRVLRVTDVDSGVDGVCRVEVGGIKSKIRNVRLGLFTSPTCQWRFRSDFCAASGTLAQDEEAFIVSIRDPEPTSIKVAAWAGSPNLTPLRFRRGFVAYGGVRIPIRKLEGTDPATITLARTPPDEWLQDPPILVTISPGCDKQLSTCQFYNNEANFQAPGHAIPPYNPALEIE